MNKKIVVLVLFIMSLNLIMPITAQNMVITYGMDSKKQISAFKQEMQNPGESENFKRLANLSLKATLEAEKSTYSLEIDKDKSFFYLDELMLSDANGSSVNELARMNADRGDFYQDATTKQVLEKRSGSKLFINYGFDFFDWELIKETETILGYTCYKAIAKYTEPHPAGGNDLRREIIVWYAPELPFNFGPQGYGGLPGLILKKCQSGSCFVATKIETKKVKIKWPKGETITREKYSKKNENTQFKFN
ncbi:GLPGLI family protein [Aequorivita marina]|uniref:GLPGLI family protein n=1 Tax=Aequorivita marina TaxID=3073654 RepID=UPI0028760D34|nr:GLPGLI family protein [Aequorivita sp. S2608]MDS1297106.1 GLPGLI family protein [Aequorivita sp. S2608]